MQEWEDIGSHTVGRFGLFKRTQRCKILLDAGSTSRMRPPCLKQTSETSFERVEHRPTEVQGLRCGFPAIRARSPQFLGTENDAGQLPDGRPTWSDIRIVPPCERQVLKDVVRALITMGVAYRWFGRPLLRFQDSEKAHARSLRLLRIASNNPLSRGTVGVAVSSEG